MAIFNKDGRPSQGATSAAAGDSALSVVAPGLTITGDLAGRGLLKVDGRVDGSIAGPRQVIIGRDGSVRGNVEATEVILAGTIEGSIIGAERVEVQGSAVLMGDVHTRSIVVHEGARLNGQVQMGAVAAAGEGDGSRPAVQVVR
jgi:cytoskeletal protein CcmA (bactofilin family)